MTRNRKEEGMTGTSASELAERLRESPITDEEQRHIEDASRHLFERCCEMRGTSEHASVAAQHDAMMRLRRRLGELEALAQPVQGAVSDADPSFANALSDSDIRIWINACNHEPARQALRQLLAYRVRGVSVPLASISARVAEASGEVLRALIQSALDLLQEKKYGNPARSPGHNAQHELKAALAALSPTPDTTASGGLPAVNGEAVEEARNLLEELKTWHGNNAGERAIKLLRRIVGGELLGPSIRDEMKRGLDALRARASRGGITTADVFSLTDPLMDALSRDILNREVSP